MKKIEIRAKPERRCRYYLFDSVEALYVWLSEGVSIEQWIKENESYLTFIEIDQPNQTLEIEWMGCEFINNHCLNYVRMARSTPTRQGKGATIAIYAGWIHSSQLTFKDQETDDAIVTRIDNRGSINLDEVFNSEV